MVFLLPVRRLRRKVEVEEVESRGVAERQWGFG